MQILLIGISLILVIVAGILSARLWCYKKQISHIKEELSFLETEESNYKLTSYCKIGKTEEVIQCINRLLAQDREEENRLKRENRVYRESITSISHDIRTPLTSAKGYLQMMQKETLPEEKRLEYIKIVERRLDNLTDMLNQLFEYARIEAGELKLEPEIINAGNVFAETISLFYEDFLKKDCEPQVHITENPCKINADKHAFVRIVENLIKNALVHGTGGYEFSLIKEKEHCIICVSNLTETVENQDIDQIFDRFYTTDKSRSRKTTGLGLAIVKRFAMQMCGDANANLKGKRFSIQVRLPVLAEKES
ncbi:MAG: HAMP domain-containing histidine kinase [Lachnospiraceae bacterium]|nr:HAMP domain-containing histidine kinase [Lachnospiraceae bacterium]